MEFEPIGPDGAEELSRIARPLFLDVYSYVPRRLVEAFLDEEQSSGAIRSQMCSGMTYAYILDGGERVGYVAYGTDGDVMRLSKLYLFDGHRGRGIGTEVIGRVESEARPLGRGRSNWRSTSATFAPYPCTSV